MRHLHQVTSLRSLSLSHGQTRRKILIDLSIGLGLPLLGIIFQYFVEGHRFNIYEDIGCYPATYTTPFAYVFVLCCFVIGVVTAVYACLIIRACTKSYHTICNYLMSSSQHVNLSHYYRLSALCVIELLFTIPRSLFNMIVYVRTISPWKGWADDHYDFSRVEQIPAVLWRTAGAQAVSLEMSRFFVVLCALIFFGFFGFEARKSYWGTLVTLVKPVGRGTVWLRDACSRQKLPDVSDTSFRSSKQSDSTLPVSTRQKLPPMRDLLASFSPNFYLSNFHSSDSVTTLAEKQEGFIPIESSNVGSIFTARSSSHWTVLDGLALLRPETAHIDADDSGRHATLDWRPSDNINPV